MVIQVQAKKLRKLVIYEVFPRNHTEEGTLKALAEDLERIKSLGVDFVWLMPIYPIGKKAGRVLLALPMP